MPDIHTNQPARGTGNGFTSRVWPGRRAAQQTKAAANKTAAVRFAVPHNRVDAKGDFETPLSTDCFSFAELVTKSVFVGLQDPGERKFRKKSRIAF
jgi:hypothetical protein